MATRTLLLFLLTGAAAGCAGSGVETAHREGTDFGAYRTWGWRPVEEAGETGADAELDRRIRAAILEVLKDRGYRPEGEAPDFLVSYSLGAAAAPFRRGGYHHGTFGWRRDVQTGAAPREGTLTLVFADARSREVLWRATAEGVVADPRSEATNVTETLRRLLAEYPPP